MGAEFVLVGVVHPFPDVFAAGEVEAGFVQTDFGVAVGFGLRVGEGGHCQVCGGVGEQERVGWADGWWWGCLCCF